MATNLTIGFLGAGKMATALARGFIHGELVGPKDIVAADPVAAARKHFAAEIGISPVASNLAVAKAAAVLILAVPSPTNVPAFWPNCATNSQTAICSFPSPPG
jgi:pyrroline-5-carboxylate reductase